ncbi:MAG: hypothetical protein E7315_02770 [Clostridiales bacterium]|nr:hypothetical protein [Clostridiales bacterium]
MNNTFHFDYTITKEDFNHYFLFAAKKYILLMLGCALVFFLGSIASWMYLKDSAMHYVLFAVGLYFMCSLLYKYIKTKRKADKSSIMKEISADFTPDSFVFNTMGSSVHVTMNHLNSISSTKHLYVFYVYYKKSEMAFLLPKRIQDNTDGFEQLIESYIRRITKNK